MKRVLSVNEKVTVILTEEGAKILCEKLMEEYVAGEQFGGIPLWHLMELFGQSMAGGDKPLPFVGGTITTDR